MQPGAMYNIGLHEYAKAFMLTWPHEAWPDLQTEGIWDNLEAASRMPREHIESVVGLPVEDPLPVAIHHYFTFPEAFRAVLPEKSASFDRIFGA